MFQRIPSCSKVPDISTSPTRQMGEVLDMVHLNQVHLLPLLVTQDDRRHIL